MRGSNEQTLKEAIDSLLKAYKLKDKLYEYRVVSGWENVMGKAVAKRTTEIYIKNRTLFVRLNSAPLKAEFSYAKSKIVAMLNEAVEYSVIDEVVLL